MKELCMKTGFPEEALLVLAHVKKITVTDDSARKKLTQYAYNSFTESSKDEYKLNEIAKILNKDLEEVLKSALRCNATLSKDAQGAYSVVGNGLVKLVNEMYGYKESKTSKEKEVTGETATANEDKGRNNKTEVPVKDYSPLAEKKKRERKPSAKGVSKATLKQLISPQERSMSEARRFLVSAKLKNIEEIALMTDEEIAKAVKEYAILTVSSGSNVLKIAVPTEELKKLDVSKIMVIE